MMIHNDFQEINHHLMTVEPLRIIRNEIKIGSIESELTAINNKTMNIAKLQLAIAKYFTNWCIWVCEIKQDESLTSSTSSGSSCWRICSSMISSWDLFGGLPRPPTRRACLLWARKVKRDEIRHIRKLQVLNIMVLININEDIITSLSLTQALISD